MKMAIRSNPPFLVLLFSFVLLFSTISLASREAQKKESESQDEPLVFEDQHFLTRAETEHGRVRVLQRFNQRSNILKGIENYRLAIFEADPQTFVVPNHWDAEGILFVAEGRGTITLVREDKSESYSLRCGHVFRVPAGITHYIINQDKNNKLVIVNLLQPVSTPGLFRAFPAAGGEEPRSYYHAFSTELLEAALNTKGDKLQRLLGKQKQGPIIKASEEQIKALSQQEEGSIWPFTESKGPFNLFDKRPSESNEHGQLYEVDPNDRGELKELSLGVGYANITQGSMAIPYYNTRATKIAVVVKGQGYFEMACPHTGEETEGGPKSTGHSIRRVSADLRQGVVFVVPAGHPVTSVASQNNNLQVLCFDINAQDNERVPIAGGRSVINQLEKEAKELAFNAREKEVDEIFQSDNKDFFVRGPRRQQHEGRAYA